MSKSNLHLAKIIITNDTAPIYNGAILIEDSKILQVGKKEDFGSIKDQVEVIDHGESLICPGFINLHCHLLYSKVKNISGEKGLFSWLSNLVDEIATWTEKDYIDSLNYGIETALSTGTTYIVENTPYVELSTKQLLQSPLKALIGIEVFGSEELFADNLFLKSLEDLENLKSTYPSLDFTFSPHAPYDVSIPLWKKLIAWSKKNNKPLLTHLEESPEENNWWQNKSGDTINFWRKINQLESKLKYWKKYNSGIDFLNKNDLLTENIIATHLCQARKEDLKVLKEKNIKLVHCPRSNFYLNNGTSNIKLWNELDLLFGLGTDSIASNENLDLLDEIRFAINRQKIVFGHNIRAKEAFQLITSNSSEILKKENEIGFLKEGYFADLNIYEITDKLLCKYKDPYEMLIFGIANKKCLKEVWVNGKKAFQREQILNRI